VASYLSETVDRCNFLVFNIKLDLNVTAIDLLRFSSGLRASHDLQRVTHVGCNQKIARIYFQKREHFNPEHFRDNCEFSVCQVFLTWVVERESEGC